MNKTDAATISAARDAGQMSSEDLGHTPGPWFVNGPWHIQAQSMPGDARPRIVAQAVDGLADVKILEANARLIAAAPELLEIVKTFVSALGRHDTITHKLATMDSPAFAYTMREARAAIAKATRGAL